ncbi:MAG: MFS transporter [Candidatus Thorarchaeota archaeon]|nr:MAG: MFS transporter [Candidatus Thorarchaeota archaeon]
MHQTREPFCLDRDSSESDIPFASKRRNRLVGYLTTFLVTFTLGTTEIFAPWYADILGGSSFELGWTMGSFGVVYMFSPAIGGRFSDRVGRKKSLAIATMAYIGVIALYLNPFASPLYLILVRALEGFVYGFIAPSIEGMVAELTPEAECAVLGNFSTSWSAGMIFSPLAIAYTEGLFGPLASIYVVIAVEIVSLGIISAFMQSYRRKSDFDSSPRTERETVDKEIKTHSRTSPRFIASYLSIMLWGVISTVVLVLFPTFVENLPGFVPEDWGNLLLVWNGVRTVAFIICARLPEELMGSVIMVGAVLSAISSAMLYFFVDLGVFAVAMIVSGVAVGFNYLGALYLIVSATDIEKGANAGLVESMGGVGLFLGPIAGGWFMDIGANLPYLMCTVLSVLVFALMVPMLRRQKQS